MKRIEFIFIGIMFASNAWACSPALPDPSDKSVAVVSPLSGPHYEAVNKKREQHQPLSAKEEALVDEHSADLKIYYSLNRDASPICKHFPKDYEPNSCEAMPCDTPWAQLRIKHTEDGRGYALSADALSQARKSMDELKKKWSSR